MLAAHRKVAPEASVTNDKCDQCGKEMRDKTELRKHMLAAHRKEAPEASGTCDKCDQCGIKMRDKTDLRKHMLSTHRNFRPCRNFFANEGTCKFKESCHFSHKEVPAAKQRCYKCGDDMENVSELMSHRKQVHNEMCRDAAKATCRFNQDTCYLNHPQIEQRSSSNQADFRMAKEQQQPPSSAAVVSKEQTELREALQVVVRLLQSVGSLEILGEALERQLKQGGT